MEVMIDILAVLERIAENAKELRIRKEGRLSAFSSKE